MDAYYTSDARKRIISAAEDRHQQLVLTLQASRAKVADRLVFVCSSYIEFFYERILDLEEQGYIMCSDIMYTKNSEHAVHMRKKEYLHAE